MSPELTPGRTLDSLKKEAKRWLKALRANVDEARARLERALPDAPHVPTLRDVQHALALEHGFPGWAALKSRLAADAHTGRVAVLDEYQAAADALLDAYRTGTPEAMERLWKHTWHRRSWEGMRTYVQLDLGKRPASEHDDVDISLDDARFIVAREHGFESWAALTAFVASLPAKPVAMAAKPVAPFFPDEPEETRRARSTRDWDAAIALMRDQRIPALAANEQMTDAVLARIAELEHVTVLKLDGSKQLSDERLRHLARMPQLQHLDGGGTAITDAGLEVLRALPRLETFSAWGTRITDAGAAHLAHCAHLARVDLGGTYTGDGAIRALTGKLNLAQVRSGNGVTNAGIALFHEFPVFKTWRGGETSMGLTSYDSAPNQLMIRGPFTDDGLAKLVGLDGLFGLNVDASELAITARGLAPLIGGLPNLGWLAFDANDDAMAYIAEMPRLRFLGCQDTHAGDDGFSALSRSRSIEYIWGRRCHNLRGRGFTALSTMPALRSLSVSCKNVDDSAIAHLPIFPSLVELMPMDIPDDGYRHIGRCERLESLVLMYCRETTDVATEHLAGLPSLKKYFASYTRVTDRTPEVLAGISSLETIQLSGIAGLTNAGVAALARLPRLRELGLDGLRNVTPDVGTLFPPHVRVRHSP